MRRGQQSRTTSALGIARALVHCDVRRANDRTAKLFNLSLTRAMWHLPCEDADGSLATEPLSHANFRKEGTMVPSCRHKSSARYALCGVRQAFRGSVAAPTYQPPCTVSTDHCGPRPWLSPADQTI